MADHLVDLLRPGGADPEMTTAIRSGFRDTCVTTKWSIDATRCFTEMAGINTAGDCASKLTIDQRDGFEHAVDTATR